MRGKTDPRKSTVRSVNAGPCVWIREPVPKLRSESLPARAWRAILLSSTLRTSRAHYIPNIFTNGMSSLCDSVIFRRGDDFRFDETHQETESEMANLQNQETTRAAHSCSLSLDFRWCTWFSLIKRQNVRLRNKKVVMLETSLVVKYNTSNFPTGTFEVVIS